ncbi:ASK1 [Candida margitis]|uniref:ASK1 n=1 Tax=Candida margitis TaxID=1775924 RepID=UPI002227A119|nr:ASK1 [Candida margitis]KAI5970087.1 ASK1 [Candida margitis]
MKRLSIAPPTSRRKSGAASSEDYNARKVLEQLDQDTTLVLQDIDKNISRANAIINDKLKPVIQDYGVESWKVWHNSGFWKKFFEQSANVVLNSFETPINEMQSSSNFLSEVEEEGINEQQPKTFTSLDMKRPDLKHVVDEDTATWSTEQHNPDRQLSASTPQRGQTQQQRSRFAAAPKMAKLPDSINLEPPTSHDTRLSPTRRHSKASPTRVQIIRQSLDAFHRISISPRKQRTPIARRSSAIENILNSSPTLPEPPVLQSEIGSEASRIHSQHTPGPSSDHEGHLQRFPNTPKYSASRYSNSLTNTPLAVLEVDEGDNDLQPPKLESETSQKSPAGVVDSESSEEVLPELNTIELKSGRKRSQTPPVGSSSKRRVTPKRSSDRRETLEEENVFLDKSRRRTRESDVNPTYNEDKSDHSRSISQIYAEGISKLKDDDDGSNAGDHADVKEVLHEVTADITQGGTREVTETLTGDLGPFQKRWRNLSKEKY